MGAQQHHRGPLQSSGAAERPYIATAGGFPWLPQSTSSWTASQKREGQEFVCDELLASNRWYHLVEAERERRWTLVADAKVHTGCRPSSTLASSISLPALSVHRKHRPERASAASLTAIASAQAAEFRNRHARFFSAGAENSSTDGLPTCCCCLHMRLLETARAVGQWQRPAAAKRSSSKYRQIGRERLARHRVQGG